MKVALWINRVLLTALSFATGAVKLARMDDEMRIFRAVAVPDEAILAFGTVQLLGAVLLLVPRTTRLGGWWMAVTFVLATGVLFGNGMNAFGVVSLLFPAMAVLHALKWPRERRSRAGRLGRRTP